MRIARVCLSLGALTISMALVASACDKPAPPDAPSTPAPSTPAPVAPAPAPASPTSPDPATPAVPAPKPGSSEKPPGSKDERDSRSGATRNDGDGKSASPGGNSNPESVPAILRGTDPDTRLRGLARAYERMLVALDPDLRTADGRKPSVTSRTRHSAAKLSAAESVQQAVLTVARLDCAASGKHAGQAAPAAAEIEAASQALVQAIHDLQDDVPANVAAAVLNDPQRGLGYWLLWILAAAVAGVVGYKHRRGIADTLQISFG